MKAYTNEPYAVALRLHTAAVVAEQQRAARDEWIAAALKLGIPRRRVAQLALCSRRTVDRHAKALGT